MNQEKPKKAQKSQEKPRKARKRKKADFGHTMHHTLNVRA
jgi:hypothetical protein